MGTVQRLSNYLVEEQKRENSCQGISAKNKVNHTQYQNDLLNME